MESGRCPDLEFDSTVAPDGRGELVPMAWLAVIFSVICLVVGALHLIRMIVTRGDRATEASHAVMGLGMAAMFAPPADPVPAPVWMAAFGASAAWFAAVALRRGCPEARHHVVASGAMLFMLLAGHSHAPGSAGAAHAGHLGSGAIGLASVVALTLVGYFAWHVLRCADHLGPAAAAAAVADDVGPDGAIALRPPALALTAPRTGVLAHLVMAAAMAVMLLGLV
jgi:hypothetical protein